MSLPVKVKDLNEIDKAYLVIFVLLYIVGCLYLGYYVIKFYQNKTKQGYLKRHPNMIVFINITLIMNVGMFGSFNLISSAYGVEYVQYDKINVHVAYLYAALANIFYVFSAHGITLGLLARTWIIFYNSKWKQETLV